MTDQAAGYDVRETQQTGVAWPIRPLAHPAPTKVIRWLAGKWTERTLSARFLIASCLVVCTTMFAVGAWIDSRIKMSVIKNAASASARYMEALIGPAIQELSQRPQLTPRAKLTVSGLIEDTSLGRSILEIKIWRPDGSVAYASDGQHVDDRPPITHELAGAISGRITADFDDTADVESADERRYGKPIFEVYAPIYEHNTKRIIAVSEFYEDATGLLRDFTIARQQSWLVVGSLTFGMLALLFGIVHRGSLLILSQKLALESKIDEQAELLRQNEQLRSRVTAANRNSAKISDQVLSRVGADLHDGPAQLLSLALLRLHEIAGEPGPAAETENRTSEALATVRQATKDALTEIRNISAGVSIPEVDRLTTREVLRLAVDNHERRTATVVHEAVDNLPMHLPPSVKTCAFRFVQEGLNNAFHHAGGQGQAVVAKMGEEKLILEVSDQGAGFMPTNQSGRSDSLGLRGLRHRVEALGGSFKIHSAIGLGTTITAIIPCSIEP